MMTANQSKEGCRYGDNCQFLHDVVLHKRARVRYPRALYPNLPAKIDERRKSDRNRPDQPDANALNVDRD